MLCKTISRLIEHENGNWDGDELCWKCAILRCVYVCERMCKMHETLKMWEKLCEVEICSRHAFTHSTHSFNRSSIHIWISHMELTNENPKSQAKDMSLKVFPCAFHVPFFLLREREREDEGGREREREFWILYLISIWIELHGFCQLFVYFLLSIFQKAAFPKWENSRKNRRLLQTFFSVALQKSEQWEMIEGLRRENKDFNLFVKLRR